MDKGNLKIDPRGLIFESYRMEGIHAAECRSIFLDWALGLPLGTDMAKALETLSDEYAIAAPDHPMSAVIREGQERAAAKPKRRGGRAGKV